MKTIGIKDLQVNPAILTRSLEADEYTMITKRSTPIGLAISFKDSVITEGLKTSIMVDAYKEGLLSLGQVAKALEMPKEKVMKILSVMGIDVIEYDFEDDMKSMDRFL
jgi:predicted HTH domain antitoxin